MSVQYRRTAPRQRLIGNCPKMTLTDQSCRLAAMTAAMVDEATQSMSVEDISNELAKLGSSYSWSSGDTFTTLRIRSLTKNLDKTVELAVASLLEPKFDQADFDRNQANTLQGIKQAKKQPSQTASEVFNKMMYGTDNNFAFGNSGTEETAQNITLEDVKAFYETHYSPKIASVIAVSDLGETALTKALAPLKAWEGGDVSSMSAKPFPKLESNTVYFIDQAGAPQSEIRIGKRALPWDATTAASITEFVNEIQGYYEDGITAEELEFTKSAIGQRDARSYETPGQKLGFLGRMMTYDLEPSFVDEQAEILQGMTKADIDALAKKHLNLDEMIMVVVGDKSKYMGEIEELGYTVVEVDADGNPVK